MFSVSISFSVYVVRNKREREQLRLNHRALNIDDDVIYISQSKVEPFFVLFKWAALSFSYYYYLVFFDLRIKNV